MILIFNRAIWQSYQETYFTRSQNYATLRKKEEPKWLLLGSCLPVHNSAPLGELFWCHFRGWSRYFSLIIMFRNGATEEPKQCHVAKRGAVFKKKVEYSARVEPKRCLRGAKTVPLLEKRSCFQAFLKTAPLRSCFGASEEP